jgi:sacsin
MVSFFCEIIGDLQGSSLTVVFEGTILNREEVCSFQLPPPWKLRGNILNYGLGLLSSYFVCDTLTILSGGYFYIFDPLGLTGGATSTATSSARYFSLLGAKNIISQFICILNRITICSTVNTWHNP